MNKKATVLVTGSAGFIGFHLSQLLIKEGYEVVGIDNFNDYYEVKLKEDRNAILQELEGFIVERGDISDVQFLKTVFEKYAFTYVVNLAAQAGVRYSLINPFAYTQANVTGFVNILERCKDHQIKHLVYASSSSVYGANTLMPFSEQHAVDHPVSLYAATKKANELLAHAYAHNFKLPVTGLRFFTVYGPWGRPDMALFLFTKAILNGEPIEVFNNGNMKRDFTYIDDIVMGVYQSMVHIPAADQNWQSDAPRPDTSYAPYRVFNIGNNEPVQLMDFVHAIEDALDKKAEIKLRPMQTGDVPNTYADVSSLESVTGIKPKTSIKNGIQNFVKWYLDYYQ